MEQSCTFKLMQSNLMKKLWIIITLISFGKILIGQESNLELFNNYFQDQDTAAQRILLMEWEATNPDDPGLYTSKFNYYFALSKQNIISIQPETENENSLVITDSLEQVVGFLEESTNYDLDLLEKAFSVIDEGIDKFPSRLDMRFGKTYALGLIEDWDMFKDEIISAINYSNLINNKWIWTNDEPVEDPENFFLSSIQGYQSQLYNTEDDSLLQTMREISETILKYYPEHIESLTNIAITYLLTENYDKGLEVLLRAEKINPQDDIILTNIAYSYKMKKDNKNAILYYQKAIEFGDSEVQNFAKEQIELLED